MKKINLSLVFLLLIVLSSFAMSTTSDDNKIKINTGLGNDVSVMDIKTFGLDTIIACGSNGKIVKSVDAGATWTTVFSAPSTGFVDAKWVNDKACYVLMSKKLVKTIDSGDSWDVVSTFDVGMESMFVVDTDTLYVVTSSSYYTVVEIPSKVMKSTDGGVNWTEKFACTTHECDLEVGYEHETCGGVWLNSMFFIDNVGYIVTGEICPLYNNDEFSNGLTDLYTIYKSTDFGDSWDTIQSVYKDWQYIGYGFVAFHKHCSEIFFTSPNSGRLYLEGLELQTEDGFESYKNIYWSLINSCDKPSGNTIIAPRISRICCDQTKACFKKDGKHTMITTVYHTPKLGDFWDVYTTLYFADGNNMWECIGYANVNDSRFECVEVVNNELFYLGCRDGIIRNYFEPTVDVETLETAVVKVYPNPVGDELRIDCGGLRLKEFEIYDVVGKRVKSVACGNVSEFTLNTSDLKQGMYVFKIYTENGIITKKINKK